MGGNAFSHRQGQKVMALKFITSFLALAISIPYWRALGLMRLKRTLRAVLQGREERDPLGCISFDLVAAAYSFIAYGFIRGRSRP
jgi:hypothetical protein